MDARTAAPHKSLTESETMDMISNRQISAGPWQAHMAREEFETFCTQPETRVDIFYFFARNPLKSPDSDE
jgi:hypothetical protein